MTNNTETRRSGMISRRSTPLDAPAPLDETRLPDGRIVHRGQELTIAGLAGRYRWQGTINPDGSLNVYGGPSGYGLLRCVRPERVRTVHRVAHMRED